MDLKKEIFYELKAQNLNVTSAWIINMYNNFLIRHPYISREEFHRTMEELSNEGYFEIGEYVGHPKYTLTYKCEKYINS